MTAEQIIEEIKNLTLEEQQEIIHYFQKQEALKQVKYADRDTAMSMADEIMTTHAELFRKLAKH